MYLESSEKCHGCVFVVRFFSSFLQLLVDLYRVSKKIFLFLLKTISWCSVSICVTLLKSIGVVLITFLPRWRNLWYASTPVHRWAPKFPIQGDDYAQSIDILFFWWVKHITQWWFLDWYEALNGYLLSIASFNRSEKDKYFLRIFLLIFCTI